MATNHTTNYALNLWEPTDAFLREEFNENTQKIDAALDALPQMVVGSYVGTGKYGAANPNTIEISNAKRPPRVILLSEGRGYYKHILIRGMTEALTLSSNGYGHSITLTWTDKGVSWYNPDSGFYQMNSGNEPYYYVALI